MRQKLIFLFLFSLYGLQAHSINEESARKHLTDVRVNGRAIPEGSICEKVLVTTMVEQQRLIFNDELQHIVPQILLITNESLVARDRIIRQKFFGLHMRRFKPGTYKKANGQIIHIQHTFEMSTDAISQQTWDKHMRGRVENITWYSAAAFSNYLSTVSGLKPVYNVKGIYFIGYESSGTLQPSPSFLQHATMFPSNPNIYQVEGFRLPTAEEFEYANSQEKEDSLIQRESDENIFIWSHESSDSRDPENSYRLVLRSIRSGNQTKIERAGFYAHQRSAEVGVRIVRTVSY